MSAENPNYRPSVRDIFLHALDKQTPAEREAYLEGACGQDIALRAKVDALLKSHQDDSFLQRPAVDFSKTAVTPASALTEGSGTLIGRYKLLQQLGEGGMGVVYMAEQTEPVTRKVALKIIKLGMDTKQVVARFEAERQALAMMDHPNIARVLDAGATDSGRPYFVMELVRGVPVTEYCDRNHLSARERLDLFMQVCQAIQHAHQKGVIHRDIKPSNVMVTLHDGRAVPKVIDFGIAKATNQRLTEKTLFTHYAQMIGTPAYMSPEQAEMSGLDVDTRTDVYALGVLLYELLTGTTPFASEELLNRGYGEMQRIIAEQEPQRPSTRLSTMQNELRTVVAKNRSTDAAALGLLFQGDLDWIVMRCLEKDRTRRYETTNELATDIHRHLRNEAVLARPPSQLYRFQKLARRNKLAFAAAAAIAAALFLGAAVSTWQAVRATKAERAARAAEREQAKLRETAQNSERTAQADRDKAQAAQKDEGEQRERAEASERTAQRNLYVANMNLAQQAWEQNNVGRVRQLLEETASHPDRGFEWYYWQRQTHRELRILPGHRGWVYSVAFSPNGERIFTAGSGDHTVKVWDTAGGKELSILKGHKSGITRITISQDGRRIATGSLDGTVKIWNATSGEELHTLHGHSLPIQAVAFSPDGRRIITGAGALGLTASRDQIAIMWDAFAGRQLQLLILKGHSAPILSVAFSPDVQRIVTGSNDGTAKIWDAVTGQELLNLKGHGSSIYRVAFSPDGRRIATGSGDKTAKLWEVASGLELLTLKGHSAEVLSVAFSPDGQSILTGSVDQTAKVWEVANARELSTLKAHSGQISSVVFSPDGRRILTGSADQTVKLWEATAAETPIRLTGHSTRIVTAAISPDGQRILTGSDDKTARVWEAVSGKELFTLKGHSDFVRRVVFSPDGRRILTCSREAKVWDAAHGKELITFTGHSGLILSAAFSPDGQRIITGSLDETAKVWEASSGKELLTLKGQSAGILSVAFSPDGRRIATADETVKVWDAVSGQEFLSLKGHGSWIGFLSFSSDGQRIITGSSDATGKLWDATSGREISTLHGHSLGIESAALSPDGKRIVTGSGDQTAKLWEATSGRELLTLKGHTQPILFVAFSADANRIVTGSRDETIKVWEAATPQQVAFWRSEEKEAEEQLAVLRREGKTYLERQRALEDSGRALLEQQKFAEAEPLLRECLELRERTAPRGWFTDDARSLLGEALLGQKRFEAAEPLLLEGYEGLKRRERSVLWSPRIKIREAIERLIQLYEGWDKPAQVAEWKEKLDAFDKTATEKNSTQPSASEGK